MTKAPIERQELRLELQDRRFDLQELRRRIYRKAKSEKTHRFWGLFVHVTKRQTLEEAYRIAKRNRGAPGVDGETFEAIEAAGLPEFLDAIRDDLKTGRYQPKPNRRVEIPKENGKVRVLQVPCIRDRVVQGAVKLILEAIFEADFCPNSYGFRPKRSPHQALAQVRRSVMRRMSTVVDVDLSKYFDTVRHSVLLDKIAKRIQDPEVMHLVKQIIKAAGKVGVPQGVHHRREDDRTRNSPRHVPAFIGPRPLAGVPCDAVQLRRCNE
jgi:retron-type reverse transcriptase